MEPPSKRSKLAQKYKESSHERLEQTFKVETVGLRTVDEFRETRAKLEALGAAAVLAGETDVAVSMEGEAESNEAKAESAIKGLPRTAAASKLSFTDLDEGLGGDEDAKDEEGISFLSAGGPPKLKLAFKDDSPEALKGTAQESQAELSLQATPASRLTSEKSEEQESVAPSGASVGLGDSPEEQEPPAAPLSPGKAGLVKMRKDPLASTDFLPDPERRAKVAEARARLVMEYESEQEKTKKTTALINYSYWTGTGHRKCLAIELGASLNQFLAKALIELSKDFPELRTYSPGQLLFIKEDFVIPNYMTFYELARDKVATAKGRVLFEFTDPDPKTGAVAEIDDAHVAKVVERKWYEQHKHMYPANKWQPLESAPT